MRQLPPLLPKAEGAENGPELLFDSTVVSEFHFLTRLAIEGGAQQGRHSDLYVVAFAVVKR
jgi:hypothetical protein